ncbi:MAG: hypothetical protein QOE90_1094 [Thermoplasmata archaeon]|jgi:hypothetical protein|nr:hypothetical protein [Thermoplasmata archaeon]
MRLLSKLITVKACLFPWKVPWLGDITTIPLTKATRDRLRSLGKKGETYDELLNRLMDVYVNRTVEFEPVK